MVLNIIKAHRLINDALIHRSVDRYIHTVIYAYHGYIHIEMFAVRLHIFIHSCSNREACVNLSYTDRRYYLGK